MWVKLDDSAPEHPKIVGLSDAAFRLWVRGLCYAGKYLTDGFLPFGAFPPAGPATAGEELVQAGLWHQRNTSGPNQRDGYQIRDFLTFNPSRADVLADREQQHNQRVNAGKARAASAVREAGRFQRTDQRPAGAAAGNAHQPRPRPRPIGTPPTPPGGFSVERTREPGREPGWLEVIRAQVRTGDATARQIYLAERWDAGERFVPPEAEGQGQAPHEIVAPRPTSSKVPEPKEGKTP